MVQKKIDENFNPTLASSLYLISTVLNAAKFAFAFELYKCSDHDPNDETNEENDLDPFQLLFMRSVISFPVIFVCVNTWSKEKLYDEITYKQIRTLVFRSLMGALSAIILFSAAKFIEATVIQTTD